MAGSPRVDLLPPCGDCVRSRTAERTETGPQPVAKRSGGPFVSSDALETSEHVHGGQQDPTTWRLGYLLNAQKRARNTKDRLPIPSYWYNPRSGFWSSPMSCVAQRHNLPASRNAAERFW
eukprot:scaffold2438_cov257-Pinguiococcus_pyrenoidosus.AAC.2